MGDIVLSGSVEILITKVSLCLNNANECLFEAGNHLTQMKEQTKHGEFLFALERLGLEHRTAQRLITTTKMLNGKYANLVNLKSSILHELSAPSTPASVRNHVNDGVGDGKKYTLNDIKRLKAEAKAEAESALKANLESTIRERSEEWRQQYLQERDKARESETKIYRLENKVKLMEEAEPKVIEVIPKGYSSLGEAIDDEKSKLGDVKRELKKARKEYRDSCNNLARLNPSSSLNIKISRNFNLIECLPASLWHYTIFYFALNYRFFGFSRPIRNSKGVIYFLMSLFWTTAFSNENCFSIISL